MNISFISIARLLAFDAPEFVTSKYALSNSAPITFDCARQTYLALRTDSWTSSQIASSVRPGRRLASTFDYRTGQKMKGLSRIGLRRLGV